MDSTGYKNRPVKDLLEMERDVWMLAVSGVLLAMLAVSQSATTVCATDTT